MIKWLVIIVAGWFLIKMLSGDRKRKSADKKKEFEQMKKTGEMVKDPICGAYVSRNSDIRVKNGDQVHCFCSYECREKYLKQIGHEPTPIERADDAWDQDETDETTVRGDTAVKDEQDKA
jgi:YHS domain-containing protein